MVALPDGTTVTGAFNVPAALVVLAVSMILIVGIRESARFNTGIVIIKVFVLLLFVAFGVKYINRANWTPFIPPNTGTFGQYGWSGVLRGAGVIFFAFIGFDAVSTAAQEATNPQRDMPRGILISLVVCTALYIAVALVLTGIVHYDKLERPRADRARRRFDRPDLAPADHQARRDRRPVEHDARHAARPTAHFLFDEPRRIAAAAIQLACIRASRRRTSRRR